MTLGPNDKVFTSKAEHDGSVYSVYQHMHREDIRREEKKDEILEQLIIEDFWE